MTVHKDVIPQTSQIYPVKTTKLSCHVCFKPGKSAASLKSHGKDGEEMKNVMAII